MKKIFILLFLVLLTSCSWNAKTGFIDDNESFTQEGFDRVWDDLQMKQTTSTTLWKVEESQKEEGTALSGIMSFFGIESSESLASAKEKKMEEVRVDKDIENIWNEIDDVMQDSDYIVEPDIIMPDSTQPYPGDDWYSTPERNVRSIPGLESFNKIEKTWGDSLNPSGDVPKNGFTAIYFDTETQDVHKTQGQERVYIYEHRDIPNIKDLGVYFVWNIEITEQWVYEFSISQSWSSTRVILDGREITGPGDILSISLKEWNYKLEVEHINNWHVADFALWFQKYQKKYSLWEISQKLSWIDTSNMKLWYAGAYESGNPNDDIELIISKESSTLALLLQSYGPVNWVIKNPSNTKIEAIVYGAYEAGSMVSGDISWVEILQTSDSLPIVYDVIPHCYDGAGEYYCEWGTREFYDVNNISKKIFWKQLDGFTGSYDPITLALPWNILTESRYEEIEKQIQEIEEKQRKSREPKSFNDIF